jgi:poly(hydroxyalkanoate) depolymerase family esterase
MLVTRFVRQPLKSGTRPTLAIPPLADNPGRLSGQLYRSDSFASGSPLVVVMHGCTQNGVAYADAAGWLALADRHGFAVLMPQQQRGNNPNLCFNWFEPGDIVRGQGEVASIKAMIDWTLVNHCVDPSRVFITGLSAGAAMAGAMLAIYPEVFAGGGLIAGLPYGSATSVQSALQQMRAPSRETGLQLAARVTATSDHEGDWPNISVWHGDADRTVAAANGLATTEQWLAVHGLQHVTPVSFDRPNYRRKTWSDAQGRALVDYVTVPQMGHGTPIDTRAPDSVGASAPYVLDVGVASSLHLLDFWRIAPAADIDGERTSTGAKPVAARPQVLEPMQVPSMPAMFRAESGVEKIINDALRAAGLLK